MAGTTIRGNPPRVVYYTREEWRTDLNQAFAAEWPEVVFDVWPL
jgi:hypothetical protein